jgi:23S rRNA (uracil1939-C5)-methyltransferase
MAYADIDATDTVLDAYCGIGTIGLIAAKEAKKVYGVENNPEAVKNAKSNAKLNTIENIEFYTADAGEFMEELTHQSYPIDVVFMDPPRSGSDEKFLKSVAKLKPKKIIYISCNPETQGRDLEQLTKEGYLVKNIQPVDMFPQTYHIETIVVLEKL